MRVVEIVILAYCGYLGLLATTRVAIPARPRDVALFAGSMAAAVALVNLAPPRPWAGLVRDWVPAICILLGYWASGAFFTAPDPRWERRLAALDRRWLPAIALGSWLRAVLELAYLTVYLLVPTGFAVVYVAGRAIDVDRYWTTVVASELACYAVLPWIQTRPPRVIEPGGTSGHASTPRRLNLAVLDRASVQANTFPSGHAAGAVATGLAVLTVQPMAGAFFLAWAALVVAGSVAGRYHYAADSVAGAAVALLAWLLATAAWAFRP